VALPLTTLMLQLTKQNLVTAKPSTSSALRRVLVTRGLSADLLLSIGFSVNVLYEFMNEPNKNESTNQKDNGKYAIPNK
jgi:hypothetical protein